MKSSIKFSVSSSIISLLSVKIWSDLDDNWVSYSHFNYNNVLIHAWATCGLGGSYSYLCYMPGYMYSSRPTPWFLLTSSNDLVRQACCTHAWFYSLNQRLCTKHIRSPWVEAAVWFYRESEQRKRWFCWTPMAVQEFDGHLDEPEWL